VSRAANHTLIGQGCGADKDQIIDENKYRAKGMIPLAFRERRDRTQNGLKNHRRDIKWALCAEMRHAFERCIDQIEREDHRE
jgi:hypothetical protein